MNRMWRAAALCCALFWMAAAGAADVPAVGSVAPEFALPDQGGRTVSVDDTASHAAFAKKYTLPFPLLADTDGRTAVHYGAMTDMWVTKFAKRYTLLIDPQGRIAKTYLKVDTSRHSAEIIADLRRLNAK